jgi:alpha-galactosidase/6-phospho-beta-glucosidase family protein
LFEVLRERITPEWRMPALQPWWPDAAKRNITTSVTNLVRFWRDLGVMIFSTEGDGMAHLKHDEAVADQARGAVPTRAEIDARLQRDREGRQAADARFQGWLTRDLDASFWAEHWKEDLTFQRQDEDIFVQVLSAVAGAGPARIAASRPNRGTIPGVKERAAVEYFLTVAGRRITPVGTVEMPDVVHGMVSALATHHLLLGDAMATQDPRLLAHALLAYPIKAYSQDARTLYRDLLTLNENELPEPLRHAKACL